MRQPHRNGGKGMEGERIGPGGSMWEGEKVMETKQHKQNDNNTVSLTHFTTEQSNAVTLTCRTVKSAKVPNLLYWYKLSWSPRAKINFCEYKLPRSRREILPEFSDFHLFMRILTIFCIFNQYFASDIKIMISRVKAISRVWTFENAKNIRKIAKVYTRESLYQ